MVPRAHRAAREGPEERDRRATRAHDWGLPERRSAKPRITLKKRGMKKMPMVVANSMPANTVVPIEWRLAAPAPPATTSGDTPRMKANEVMRIGRKRWRAAWTAAR